MAEDIRSTFAGESEKLLDNSYKQPPVVWLAILLPYALEATAYDTLDTNFPAIAPVEVDSCAALAGKRWVAPSDVRKCFRSFEVDEAVKSNSLDVINGTLAFHTSVNYQIQAPEPFSDVHEDLLYDLARIKATDYASDFDLHLDLSSTLKRLNDGHCVWINRCYDALYVTYLPTPLVLLTGLDGTQDIHIAPEAFSVSSVEFSDEIDVWQNALPGELQGHLASLSGAKVLSINGNDPFVAVNKNALITGGYQSFATRQNSFFSSYFVASDGWNYAMGNFAQQTLPLNDVAILTVQLTGSSEIHNITLPYRSRFGSASKNFTDSASYREANCKATNRTNGFDIYATPKDLSSGLEDSEITVSIFQQQPRISVDDSRKHAINVMLDTIPRSDIVLPLSLHPSPSPLNESYSVAQFYMLKDNVTGVLALGSFSARNFTLFQESLLSGLLALKSSGATQLVVDVTNNGGGYICIAHWLRRIIIGPKFTTEPQAGLDTEVRAGPLAKLIVKKVIGGIDPDEQMSYNPVQWRNATHHDFEHGTDWLKSTVEVTVNGRKDEFSQRLGQECQPFSQDPPDEPLFESSKVVIVSNGRCASSCSLFSITMSKLDGVKTIVVGGKKDVPQQYCGVVGGQSTDFSTIDTEIKTAQLKNHTLAPPDLLTNSVQGITWRLGFGIDNPREPEEWQSHPADRNLPLTFHNINKPLAIWEDVAMQVLSEKSLSELVVQE